MPRGCRDRRREQGRGRRTARGSAADPLGGGPPLGGGSSWQSLARGLGSIEADFLNGEIALLGRLHGIETPVNALLQERAREAALLGLPPGQVSAESLLELVEARGG